MDRTGSCFYPFEDTKLRGARAGIRRSLFIGGHTPLAKFLGDSKRRLWALVVGDRYAVGEGWVLAAFPKGEFDAPIFKRVKADNGEATADLEPLRGVAEHGVELVELSVHHDA